MKSRNLLLGVVLTLFICSNQVFSLENYATKYQKNDKIAAIKARLEKEIARKRFALEHSATYYYEIGKKFHEQGELKKAVQNYEYAIFLEPESSGDYYNSLAEIYYFLGEFSESIAYLRTGLKYPFTYRFDQMKAWYLLTTNYFRLKNDKEAVSILKKITGEYQQEVDRQAINGLHIKYEYYAPAFFLLSLYYRNHSEPENYPTLLQKTLQLGFKKEYTNYFLYELYHSRGQEGIAWEYLKRAKEIRPNIEVNLKLQPWVRTYDLYTEIIRK